MQKVCGVALERNLSSDSGIDLDSDSGARKMYASLVQHQGQEVRSFLNPTYRFLIPHSRPRSRPSTTQRPNERSSPRTMTRKPGVPIETCAAYSAPQRHPQRLPWAS